MKFLPDLPRGIVDVVILVIVSHKALAAAHLTEAEALKELALALFAQERLTLAQAARIAGVGGWTFKLGWRSGRFPFTMMSRSCPSRARRFLPRIRRWHASEAAIDPPKPAIRPYPVQYAKEWRFEDGTEVMIRPIKPEDEPLIVRFHAHVSEHSVYLRYFHLMDLELRVSHERLIRICVIDYDREIALVAELRGEIPAVGRLVKSRGLGTKLWRLRPRFPAGVGRCRDDGESLDWRHPDALTLWALAADP